MPELDLVSVYCSTKEKKLQLCDLESQEWEMTPHRNKDVEGDRGQTAAIVEVGGVRGTLADLRTPEPGAVRCTMERQGGVR